MPGKSFRECNVRAGIRANLADNFNGICHEGSGASAEMPLKTQSSG